MYIYIYIYICIHTHVYRQPGRVQQPSNHQKSWNAGWWKLRAGPGGQGQGEEFELKTQLTKKGNSLWFLGFSDFSKIRYNPIFNRSGGPLTDRNRCRVKVCIFWPKERSIAENVEKPSKYQKKIWKNRCLFNKNPIFIQKTQNSDIFDECMGPNLLNIKKIPFFLSGGSWGPIFFIGGPMGPHFFISGGPWGP